jgi:hypothetical protein
MIARIATRFGLNYAYGVFMFTLGVIGGSAVVGVVTGIFGGTISCALS